MPVISIRFVSFRFVSFRFISSQPLREGKREGGKRTALRLGKVLCLDLLGLGCYREGRVYYKKILLADMRLGFAVVVGCAVR